MKYHPIFLLSASAALLLLFMILYGISTGTSQQNFELVNTINNYSSDLLIQATPIRTIIGFDNIFIALYTSVIVFVVVQLRRDNRSAKELLYIILACGLMAGALDYLENFHIITMLSSLEYGVALDALEVKQQMVWSMFKWHLSYFAFFLLAFALKPRNLLEKLFCLSLLFIQLPVGVFYYILEGSRAGDILFYARYANLVFGFVIIGVIFYFRSITQADVITNVAIDAAKGASKDGIAKSPLSVSRVTHDNGVGLTS